MEFKHKTLNNGLTIIAEKNKYAQSAAVGFFVKTGSRDENNAISGVSHFLEHMMFKGTDKLSCFDVNETFDRTGAKFNAFTSEENTVYYAAVLPEYLEQVTDLWAQLMRPALRDDDFTMEKNVIKEEIAMYKDMPQFEVLDHARNLHFGQHPCGFSVLGTNQSIDDLTAEQMRTYFKSRYAPNNITVALSGNFDFDKITSLIESKASLWTTQPAPRKLEYFAGTFKREKIHKPNLVCEHICLVSPSVSMQDKDRYAASLLANIIGDDSGSRFFWELVDSALAEEASMQCDAMDGVGTNFTYIQTSPEKAEQVTEIVDKIFAKISIEGITENELVAAKNKMLSAITIKNEVPMGRLVELGINWVYLQRYVDIDETVQQIKSVTVKQVNDLIEKYKLTDYTSVVLTPKE
jgi:predicted Zn-dependent peptidase